MTDYNVRLDRIEAILDRTAQRQAGLAETVEILGAMQIKGQERMREIEANMAKLDGHMANLTVTMERLDSLDGGGQ